jgi:hypothetical protein
MTMGLLCGLTLWSMCVCVGGGWGGGDFGFNDFVTKAQPFLVDGHYRMDIISGVGYPRSDSVVLLVLCMVAMQFGAPILYYRSLGTASNLLRRDNILS